MQTLLISSLIQRVIFLFVLFSSDYKFQWAFMTSVFTSSSATIQVLDSLINFKESQLMLIQSFVGV